MDSQDEGHVTQLEQLNTELALLIKALRSSHPSQEVMTAVQQQVERARELLSPIQQQGEGWSTISIAEKRPALHWNDDDLTACMPYSPVSGRRNAVAPRIRLYRDGDEVRGEAVFNETFAGPPDSVHGGYVAAVFDELLSMATVILGDAGFTGTLSVRYHKKTPLGEPVELWSKLEEIQGRKLITRGEMRVNGAVTASAEAIFIRTPELEGSDREVAGKR